MSRCSGCPVKLGHDCDRLARKGTKPPTPYGLDSCSLIMADRRCDHCGFRLAQALVDAEPDTATHPACEGISVWLHHQVGTPMLRYSRR